MIERNVEDGVTWVASYVSADKRASFCVYDAPMPEAIRRHMWPDQRASKDDRRT